MRKHNGFTIVELLIVIVIIGVLAMISVVAYNGVQSKARDSIVQNDLSTAMRQLAVYRTQYTTPLDVPSLRGVDIRITKNAYMTKKRHNFYFCANRITGEYAIGAITIDDHYFLATSLESIRSFDISLASASNVCNSVGGLTGNTDTNAYSVLGYNNDTDTWGSWVK